MTPEYIVIHHSATVDGKHTLSFDQIRQYHIGHNGWRDIGYHGVIEQVDETYVMLVGRPWITRGAHAVPLNAKSLGLCLVGNFSVAVPPMDLLKFAVTQVRWLQKLYQIPVARVLGHREAHPGHTECPGRHFDMDDFRKRLR